jgi:hypothetical protein
VDQDILTFEIRRFELEFRMLCDIVESLEKSGKTESAKDVEEAIECLSQAKSRLEVARIEAKDIPEKAEKLSFYYVPKPEDKTS